MVTDMPAATATTTQILGVLRESPTDALSKAHTLRPARQTHTQIRIIGNGGASHGDCVKTVCDSLTLTCALPPPPPPKKTQVGIPVDHHLLHMVEGGGLAVAAVGTIAATLGELLAVRAIWKVQRDKKQAELDASATAAAAALDEASGETARQQQQQGLQMQQQELQVRSQHEGLQSQSQQQQQQRRPWWRLWGRKRQQQGLTAKIILDEDQEEEFRELVQELTAKQQAAAGSSGSDGGSNGSRELVHEISAEQQAAAGSSRSSGTSDGGSSAAVVAAAADDAAGWRWDDGTEGSSNGSGVAEQQPVFDADGGSSGSSGSVSELLGDRDSSRTK